MFTKRDVLVALLTGCSVLSVFALAQPQKPLMGSAVFDWKIIEVKPTKVGARRDFFQSPTATLDELECHVTTVNPGEEPHAPHQHPDEELIIVKEGTLEFLVNGEKKDGWAWLSRLSGLESDARYPQCREDTGHLPCHQVEIAWGAKRQVERVAMPLPFEAHTEKVRNDFDEIARLSDDGESGIDRYDSFLLSLVPPEAVTVIELGCGLGRLTTQLATGNREVTGIDLSPAMIERARLQVTATRRVTFLCGDFLVQDFGSEKFDCVISAAMLHHMSEELAVRRMVGLLRPGGRLVIQDLRRDTCLLDRVQSHAALAQVAFERLLRTGWPLRSRAVREAWERHGAGETYLTLQEAHALADRLLPGARVFNHWLWRYTLVWDKGNAA